MYVQLFFWLWYNLNNSRIELNIYVITSIKSVPIEQFVFIILLILIKVRDPPPVSYGSIIKDFWRFNLCEPLCRLRYVGFWFASLFILLSNVWFLSIIISNSFNFIDFNY